MESSSVAFDNDDKLYKPNNERIFFSTYTKKYVYWKTVINRYWFSEVYYRAFPTYPHMWNIIKLIVDTFIL